MSNRDLKNLGINLTDEEVSSERKLRERKENKSNLNNSKKPTSKIPKQRNNMPDLETPANTPVDTEAKKIEVKDMATQNVNTDPNLQGLSPTKLAYINSLVQTQMMKVASSMRSVPLNPAISVPLYDEGNMTSQTFFSQCELYLQSQGFQSPQFHEVIRIILASDPSKKLWYDNVSASIKSWEDFKNEFRVKYDSPLVQERRKDRLRRKQHINEPVENYVYEIVNLSRQISPGEEESISVLRAKRGLIPELSLYIGECNTVNELLEKASLAIETIRARDRMTSRHTRLPPYSVRTESRGSFMQQSSFGRGRNYGNFSNTNRFQQSNEAQQQQSQLHSFNRFQSNDSNFRPRLGSAPSRYPSRENSIVCHSCGEKGHIARFCQQKQSSVSTGQNAGTSGTQMGRYNHLQNQAQNTNNTQRLPGNLNSLGR